MPKFISLTSASNGKDILFNIDNIVCIIDADKGGAFVCLVDRIDSHIHVSESLQEIVRRLA